MRSSGTAIPLTLTSCSMAVSFSVHQLAGIGDVPGQRRGRDRRGARQMGPRLRPLSALEIAVGGADHPLILQPVIAHMAAEGTARFMPLEAGLLENRVEPLRL